MKNRAINRRLFAAVLATVLVATLGVWAWRVFGPDAGGGARTVTVQRGTLRATIATSGRLVARRTASVSSPAGGAVKIVAVRAGEAVRRGDVLVVLDDAPARAEIARAERAVETAELRVGVVRARAANNETLLPEVAAAEREAADARAALATANDRLAGTLIVAPFDGVVDTLRVTEGGAYAPGSEALTLAAAGELVISADLDEVDRPLVSVGQEVAVTVTAFAGTPLTGRISFLSDTAQSRGGTTIYPMTVEIADARGLALTPGMTVELRIVTTAREGVLLLPSEAIRRANERRYVTVRRGGRETEVEVRLGLRSGDEVEIVDGLSEGDELVLR